MKREKGRKERKEVDLERFRMKKRETWHRGLITDYKRN